MKLGAALATNRYNDGYKVVQDILDSFSISSLSIRTQEVLHQLDNNRIMNSIDLTPCKDTFAEDEARMANRRDQIGKHGTGYSHGMYSRAESVTVDMDDPDIQEYSQDDTSL